MPIHEARRCMVVHTALQAPSRLRQMRSFAFKLSASGCQSDGCTEELEASSLESRGPEQRLSNKSCTLHAAEILLLSFLLPTDDVCLAQVGTALPDFDVEASCQGHVLEVLSDCFGPGAVKQLVAARVGARSVLDHRLPV
ncbi:unnamed protein product [Polarella glacialis]|uniref:Uncharacterized protein n=2 Tax=Polarella glacialis TaxID=89957 RepID=A0A813FDW3_POLGL|nr:unnamed protein product [Polarella glacialis]